MPLKWNFQSEQKKHWRVPGLIYSSFTSYLPKICATSAQIQEVSTNFRSKTKTRSDILQGQALFRGVKHLRKKIDKETDRHKEKRQEKTRKDMKRHEKT